MRTIVFGDVIWTSILHLLILCVVFSGISEMIKTPVNPRKGRSVINENNAAKTPAGTSVVEPSVLNTPEEPGTVCGGIVYWERTKA